MGQHHLRGLFKKTSLAVGAISRSDSGVSIIVRGSVRADERAPGGLSNRRSRCQVVQIATLPDHAKKEHGVEFLMDSIACLSKGINDDCPSGTQRRSFGVIGRSADLHDFDIDYVEFEAAGARSSARTLPRYR